MFLILLAIPTNGRPLSENTAFNLACTVAVVMAFSGYLDFSIRAKACVARCRPTCAVPFWAVAFTGWKGSVSTFDFYSRDYAEMFSAANGKKVLGRVFESKARMGLDSAVELNLTPSVTSVDRPAPTIVPPDAGRQKAELVAYERCVAKLESAKGPASRQAALEVAMEAIRDADLRRKLLRAATRIEVQAVLDKVDTLKFNSAKRRHLQAAVESLSGNALEVEHKQQELNQLRAALDELKDH